MLYGYIAGFVINEVREFEGVNALDEYLDYELKMNVDLVILVSIYTSVLTIALLDADENQMLESITLLRSEMSEADWQGLKERLHDYT